MPFILVIDDEQPIRELLRLILETEGHTVWEASNGKEGLQVYEEEPVDLVLCDIYMDVQEGLGTILQLRRKDPTVKIIAMSGGSPRFAGDHLSEAKALGALAALPKPLDRGLLLENVNRALQKVD